jgi:hypothetical protein
VRSIIALTLLALGCPAAANDVAGGGAAAVDYADESHWLCRPEHPRACATDQTATVVSAEGELSRETFQADPDAPVDCFYVYPTVSLDSTPNSDLSAGPEELSVVDGQFARFGSVCRTFAPLYRQVTLAALRAGMAGQAMAVDRDLGYQDVLAAWNHYLEHDNQGRGVVLIGHSQGAGVLTRLVADEIDGKAVQEQLISALILGSSGVTLADENGEGATFDSVPVCRAPDQTGCVVQFASFRATLPPPADSLFGRPREGGGTSVCVNPANVAGGPGELDAYLRNGPDSSWLTPAQQIDTPFVKVPGLLSAQCVEERGLSYLEVTVHADPDDPRADDIPGDVMRDGQIAAGWGLHLIDVHLAMGNLVELVRRQARAYVARE